MLIMFSHRCILSIYYKAFGFTIYDCWVHS